MAIIGFGAASAIIDSALPGEIVNLTEDPFTTPALIVGDGDDFAIIEGSRDDLLELVAGLARQVWAMPTDNPKDVAAVAQIAAALTEKMLGQERCRGAA